MSSTPSAPGARAWCDACMSSGRCWVCDGEGALDGRSGFADCSSCGSTGICRHCAPAAAQVVAPASEPG